MLKAISLYVLFLSALFAANLIPSPGWLLPLSLVFLLVCTLWLWQRSGRPFLMLGFQRSPSCQRHLSWGLIIGVALPLLATGLQVGARWLTLSPTSLTVPTLTRILVLAVVRLGAIAAFKELVFRGYFLQIFLDRFGGPWAILISPLLWGFTHLPDMVASGLSPMQMSTGMITSALWGMALATGCLRTGTSLWLPFGLHYRTNLSFSLVGGFTQKTSLAPAWLIGHPAWMPESGLVGVLLWVVGITVIWLITLRLVGWILSSD